MFIGKEEDGWYKQCLQCSYERGLNITLKPEEQSVKSMVVGATSQ